MSIKRILVLVALLSVHLPATCLNPLSTASLTCEHRINPMGIDELHPRFSWVIRSDETQVMQTAYQIRVSLTADFSKDKIVWDTGNVPSGESVLQPYAGKPLLSGQRYYWQVRVSDNHGHHSAWSAPAFFEMGLLRASDWKAAWIVPVQDTAKLAPVPFLRRDFTANKKIAKARVYVTSHGLYELSLNGQRVGDQYLTPGWTSYHKRLQYQVYDVSAMIRSGKNAVGVMLGEGWYRGSLGWEDNNALWGDSLAVLLQLALEYTDGTRELVVSDGSWKSMAAGPILYSGIYAGEVYDARKEINGWNTPGFNDADWKPVTVLSAGVANLVASESVPVRKIQEIKPVRIFKSPKGSIIADFGQNMVGWVRLSVQGQAGNTITLRHAEVLDKYGEFYTTNLRSAVASLSYTLRGGTKEVFEPHFTFFGFRFVEIKGFTGMPTIENLTGVVVHSDMTVQGSFECSNPLINQLQHNIQWGQKGNFLDVPTDCPQRDERLGWTGDAQAFYRTAAFNMDVSSFFSKWLKDVKADQGQDGKVPFVVPDVLRNNGTSAGWGDVSTIIPWELYQVSGDRRILENQYTSMKAYVDYIERTAGKARIWKGGSVFGDWLFYKPAMYSHPEPDGYTNPDMIATMFFAYSSRIMSHAAGALGKADDARYYQSLYEEIKSVFNREYVTPTGRIASDSQTAYVLALQFGLLSDEQQAAAAQYLDQDIHARGNHLSTGFLGTPYLCHVLSSHGKLSTAYDLLLQENYPSWLFPVKMGATTIWERWDGQKPDSTFQDPGMNSFNHYAYGAIGDWMYQVVAGIRPGSPGYKQIDIKPEPDKRVSHAKATFESPYGQIVSGYRYDGDLLTIEVTIPCNTQARVFLPGSPMDVKAKGITLNKDNIQWKDTTKWISLGSGSYSFQYKTR